MEEIICDVRSIPKQYLLGCWFTGLDIPIKTICLTVLLQCEPLPFANFTSSKLLDTLISLHREDKTQKNLNCSHHTLTYSSIK